MKILVFIDDPTIAHDIVRTVGRMTRRFEPAPEIHLSRVQRFEYFRNMAGLKMDVVGVGASDSGNGGATAVLDHAVEVDSAADEYLARLAHRYLSGVPTKRVIFGATPAAEIIAYAQEEKIDLLAIADQGEWGIGPMLLFNSPVPVFKIQCSRPARSKELVEAEV